MLAQLMYTGPQCFLERISPRGIHQFDGLTAREPARTILDDCFGPPSKMIPKIKAAKTEMNHWQKKCGFDATSTCWLLPMTGINDDNKNGASRDLYQLAAGCICNHLYFRNMMILHFFGGTQPVNTNLQGMLEAKMSKQPVLLPQLTPTPYSVAIKPNPTESPCLFTSVYIYSMNNIYHYIIIVYPYSVDFPIEKMVDFQWHLASCADLHINSMMAVRSTVESPMESLRWRHGELRNVKKSFRMEKRFIEIQRDFK